MSSPLCRRERVGVDRLAGPAHHEGGDHLAPLGVGQAEHGDLGDGGMRVQRVLDFAGVDVEAAADHHVLVAAHDVEEAFVVEAAEVAAVVPAVADGFALQVGPAPEGDFADAAVRDRDFADLAGLRAAGRRHRAR